MIYTRSPGSEVKLTSSKVAAKIDPLCTPSVIKPPNNKAANLKGCRRRLGFCRELKMVKLFRMVIFLPYSSDKARAAERSS